MHIRLGVRLHRADELQIFGLDFVGRISAEYPFHVDKPLYCSYVTALEYELSTSVSFVSCIKSYVIAV